MRNLILGLLFFCSDIVYAEGKHCPIDRPMKGRENAVFITVPDKSLYSDADAFGAFAEQSIEPVRQAILDGLDRNDFDNGAGTRYFLPLHAKAGYVVDGPYHVVADPVQPRRHYFTYNYNPFSPMEELVSGLCDLVATFPGDSQKNTWILSSGYGSKIVSLAIRDCLLRKINHIMVYPDENPGYFPPADSYYQFGKSDVYAYQEEQVSAEVRTLQSRFDYPDLATRRAIQWDLSPHKAQWSGAIYPQLKDNYAFLYQNNEMLPINAQEYRFELALLLAGWSINYAAIEHRSLTTVGSESVYECSTSFCFYDYFNLWCDYAGGIRVDRILPPISPLAGSETPYPPFLLNYFNTQYRRTGFGNHPPAPPAQPITCGDGRTEGREQCDPPQPDLCSQDCKRIEKCGNKRLEGEEDCDSTSNPDPLCEITAIGEGGSCRAYTGRCEKCKCEYGSTPCPEPGE